MGSSGKQDQDQRKITSMENSKTTIEFLRARLLAERSVSRTARQRADELAQRVSELEEQLTFVCLQRKKAEKATAAVLSILENHGVTDASDESDSGSDQEAIFSESKDAENKTEGKGTSSSVKEKEKDANTFSSSEIESSLSTGRSLSWKSGQSSLRSLDRRRYTDSNRRRCSSFAPTSISSPKRAGKSCRRIRRRDTSAPHSLTDSAGNSGLNDQVHVHASCVSKNEKQADESDEDMERALERQAQLIGQHESQEKAQREWEEKYRESNSYTPDSYDPGNYSDVTEERDDLKASQEPCLAGTSGLQNHANQYGAAVVPSTEETVTTNNSPSTPSVDMVSLKDKKSSGLVNSDSPTSEFAFPMPNGNCSENHVQTSAYSQNQSVPVKCSPMHPSGHTIPSSGGSSLHAGQAFQRGYQPALVSHNTSNTVNSVLGALEQAKLSLGQQINSSPLVTGGSSVKAIERFTPATRIGDTPEVPVGCPGLFRLQTDFQLEATTTASYPSPVSRFSSENYSPGPGSYRFSTIPYVESPSNFNTGNMFPSLSTRPFTDVYSAVPSQRHVRETTFDAGLPSSIRRNYLNRH